MIKLSKGDCVKVKGGKGWGNAIGKVIKRDNGTIIVHFPKGLRKRTLTWIGAHGERRIKKLESQGTYAFRPGELKRSKCGGK